MSDRKANRPSPSIQLPFTRGRGCWAGFPFFSKHHSLTCSNPKNKLPDWLRQKERNTLLHCYPVTTYEPTNLLLGFTERGHDHCFQPIWLPFGISLHVALLLVLFFNASKCNGSVNSVLQFKMHDGADSIGWNLVNVHKHDVKERS